MESSATAAALPDKISTFPWSLLGQLLRLRWRLLQGCTNADDSKLTNASVCLTLMMYSCSDLLHWHLGAEGILRGMMLQVYLACMKDKCMKGLAGLCQHTSR